MLSVQLINISHRNYIPIALHTIKCFAETNEFIKKNAEIKIVEPQDISDHDSIIEDLTKTNPHLIGCSLYVWSAHATLVLLRRIRSVLPHIKIVVGGPDVTPVALEFMEENHSFIDYVVMGEGELTFSELLEWIISPRDKILHEISGLCFFDGLKVVTTQKRPVIEDLDTIPSPYLTGSIDLKTERRVILLETYRGCPYACSFCYYPKDYGSNIHSYGMKRLDEELKFIFEHGVTDLLLMDPTFNVPPKRAVDILKIVSKYKKDSLVRINTELRIDHLTDEVIHWFEEAGFRAVELGLQSANQKVLQAVARVQDLKKTKDNIDKLKQRNILLITQLIVGLPKDDYESIKNSIQFAIDLGSEKIEMYQLQLLPGTPMFRDAKHLGLIFNDKPPRMIQHTPTMSEELIRKTMRFTKYVYLFHCHRAARTTFNCIARILNMRMIDLIESFFEWFNTSSQGLNLLDLTNNWNKDCLLFKRSPYSEHNPLQPLRLKDFFEELEKENGLGISFIASELLKLDYYLSANFIKVQNRAREIDSDELKYSGNFFRVDKLKIDPFKALEGEVVHLNNETSYLFYPDYYNTFKTVLNGTISTVKILGPCSIEEINEIQQNINKRIELIDQQFITKDKKSIGELDV